jgi:hypothetical protein
MSVRLEHLLAGLLGFIAGSLWWLVFYWFFALSY